MNRQGERKRSKIIVVIAKSSMVQTVGKKPGVPTPCTGNLYRYRLGPSPVGTQCYKTLVFYKVACPAQCTVGPTQAKSNLISRV